MIYINLKRQKIGVFLRLLRGPFSSLFLLVQLTGALVEERMVA
ncbi:hypothetical protein JOC77_004336 [Peribacillus deserti]|uniref:Uncharacterized protein n=1 Tax=Peribacillus deserti TaxID=673318 RepID=A0ABS2QP17_9BACI|nr:hypothetical protein [Peribacillus deserti]